jgi:hypothetical protein
MGGKKKGHKGGPKGASKVLQAINSGSKKGDPIATAKSTTSTVTVNSLEDLGKVYNTVTEVVTPKMTIPTISVPVLQTPTIVTSSVQVIEPPLVAQNITPKPVVVEAPVMTAVKMERARITPPTTTKVITPKKGWGIVLETTISVDGDKWFTKILTELPNKDGVREWTTILAYKPAGKMPLYAECEFTIGSYQNRPTAVDVEIISTDTPTKAFFELLTSPEVVAHQTPLKQVYISDLIAKQQEATLIGATLAEKVKNFLTANGIIDILGIMNDGSLIVRTGRENNSVGRNSNL